MLLHTGDDARFGTPQYADGAHFLTRDGAAWLAGHDPALVGIDAVNIDDTADGERPAHTLLLAAGIPVIEHLTGLEQLPPVRRLLHRSAAAHRGAGDHPGASIRPTAHNRAIITPCIWRYMAEGGHLISITRITPSASGVCSGAVSARVTRGRGRPPA